MTNKYIVTLLIQGTEEWEVEAESEEEAARLAHEGTGEMTERVCDSEGTESASVRLDPNATPFVGLATFWDLVDDLGWAEVDSPAAGTRTRIEQRRRTDDIERTLLHTWTPDFTDGFRERMREVQSELAEAVTAWETRNGGDLISLGDDGFSDLLWHIVGLGRDEWQRCIDNPQRVKARADKDDFVECWSYCIPDTGRPYSAWEATEKRLREQGSTDAHIEYVKWNQQGDFAKVEPGYYKAWARLVLEDWEGDKRLPEWTHEARTDYEKVTAALRDVANADPGTDDLDDAIVLAGATANGLHLAMKRLRKWATTHGRSKWEVAWNAGGVSGYSAETWLLDMTRYYLDLGDCRPK